MSLAGSDLRADRDPPRCRRLRHPTKELDSLSGNRLWLAVTLNSLAEPVVATKWLTVLALVMGAMGCQRGSGVRLGQVSGRVFFYGVPVRAELLFQPVDDRDVPTGRPSTAFADLTGRYELSFTEAERGAAVGRHLVTVKVYVDADTSAALERPDAAVPIRITRVVRQVADGRNTYDFALNY